MKNSAPQNYRIDLHIEELIMEGFANGDQFRIVAAMQRELNRLLSEGNSPAALTKNGSIERLEGGVMQIEPGEMPEITGKRIAQNLHRGLQR